MLGYLFNRLIFNIFLFTLIAACFVLATCDDSEAKSASIESWEATKATEIPQNDLPKEFAAPRIQSNATLAWEDGVYITRDGLTLYTDYYEADVWSALTAGAIPRQTYLYQRGPYIGQDFNDPSWLNPPKPFPWIHADIAYAHRNSVSDPFPGWQLTERKGRGYDSGAPQGILNQTDHQRFDFFVYTSDETGPVRIMLMRNTDLSLSGSAAALPSNVDNPKYDEDNPHIERRDATNSNKLVLFFDSDNWPCGQPCNQSKGQRNIWYTLSDNAGETWTEPSPVTSVDTQTGSAQQPHLYRDTTGQWWIYYTDYDSQGKLAIYRARQEKAGDWNSWAEKQLVVSAGSAHGPESSAQGVACSAEGVGEPTLTQNGDLSFVLVTCNSHGTTTDKYDSDPWFMPKSVYSRGVIIKHGIAICCNATQ